MMSCEYERLRLKNVEDNKRILAQLGLLNPVRITATDEYYNILRLFAKSCGCGGSE